MAKAQELFVACAPGLEPWLSGELTSLGLSKNRLKTGGVSVKAKANGHDTWRANLGSALAMRVWRVLGRQQIDNFPMLEGAAKSIDWTQHLPKGTKVRLDVHCKKSKLYHSGAVAERVGKAMQAQGLKPSPDADGWRVQVRLVRDQLRWAVDTSGEQLTKRGYKARSAKAPLRADLARLALIVSGWEPGRPLLDPMMGSGTIVLEAAAWASGRPTGWHRRFAFQDTPGFDAAAFGELREALVQARTPSAIFGSDRDPGAVDAARYNAKALGELDAMTLEQAALSSRELLDVLRGGELVSNPPYGLRTGKEASLVGLYRSVGTLAARQGMGLSLWSSRWDLLQAISPQPSAAVHSDLGGIKVTLARRPLASDEPEAEAENQS